MALRIAITGIAIVFSLFVSLFLIEWFIMSWSPLPGGTYHVTATISDLSSWSLDYSVIVGSRSSAEFLSTAIPICVYLELTLAQLASAYGLYRLLRWLLFRGPLAKRATSS
jgi:hypothetical protein